MYGLRVVRVVVRVMVRVVRVSPGARVLRVRQLRLLHHGVSRRRSCRHLARVRAVGPAVNVRGVACVCPRVPPSGALQPLPAAHPHSR